MVGSQASACSQALSEHRSAGPKGRSDAGKSASMVRRRTKPHGAGAEPLLQPPTFPAPPPTSTPRNVLPGVPVPSPPTGFGRAKCKVQTSSAERNSGPINPTWQAHYSRCTLFPYHKVFGANIPHIPPNTLVSFYKCFYKHCQPNHTTIVSGGCYYYHLPFHKGKTEIEMG